MAFPDFEFDKDLPSFILHTDVLRYLKDYAAHFELLKYIKFQTLVLEVDPAEYQVSTSSAKLGHKWKVTFAPVTDRSNLVTEEYDAVVVCNGHYAVPKIPDIPGLGAFEGEVMHSHNYRTPKLFQDKTVLCLGAGPSGQDICVELASTARMVYLCHNKPLLETPLPDNVQQKPGIDFIKGFKVTLLNGEEHHVDFILFCTGYYFNFPFLTDKCHVNISDGCIMPLYKHLIHTEFPSLFFIGICKTVVPFPLFHFQVKLVQAVLEGAVKLPSKEEMDADTEAEYQKRRSEGLPHRHFHVLASQQWEYNDEMALMAGCSKLPDWVRNLDGAVRIMRRKNITQYKNVNFVLLDGESFAIAS
ncbi:flavin-containing monooxygenase FMO GS-OX-like 4 isoform X2 [Pomacea canaliculata]|nr:flavin-containing monooxygenase FMO GS-OX-like 4 isoform X2 [Pomacea canaliculata]